MRIRLAHACLFAVLSAPISYAQNAAPSVTPDNKVVQTEKHKTAHFVDLKTGDLLSLLPAPPSQESERTQAELAELHAIEKARTPEAAARAKSDSSRENLFLYADVLGEKFNAEALPKTAELSAHLAEDESIVSKKLKDEYKRPRPYNFDKTLQPVCKTSMEPSYPSGHSLIGWLTALTMTQITPEKREQIMARAEEFARNRMVCGVHYRSDIETSKNLAYLLFGRMLLNPEFQKELAAARTETRKQLGLPETPQD